MYLSRLSLHNFRNYADLDLTLGPGLFIFYGENAQGKTNLLEAVSFLATATSFHATSDREVVSWYAPEHIARIEGAVKRRESAIEIETTIFDPTPPSVVPQPASPAKQEEIPIELPTNTPRKRLKLNSIPRRTMEVIGQMKVVLFAPADLHLVDGSPDERRRFLDRALCQVNPRYCQALVKYRKIVTQRAALLKRIRDNQEDPLMLDYLDEQLTNLAAQITHERLQMVIALNQEAAVFQQKISGGREQLQVLYRPSFKTDEIWNHSEVAQHYRSQLHTARRKEILQGVCLLGPHRDDIEFLVNDMNVLTYGSRGQQRTAALSTKLAELAYMRASTGDEPVLLFDDVFSELDQARREYLLEQVFQHEQVLLTATDLSSFPGEIAARANIFKVSNGILQSAQNNHTSPTTEMAPLSADEPLSESHEQR
ncbi:DNA replication/repair protein RecF [Ktedonosporobacter rubrisoli]|uniref:DNA replication and repair protein RecF n=1 Tax=Ktedonosporobacter rubrisoli TaxID=2509675 RepID=A0A4P6JZ26_KTERU|nr:DNA replication/repair protein RecF [Ktedonosporobacter rubrisoli]QBD81027.1 DNA replication/repair protein RecF [Ktedonosporobacter rubrisoli]